MWVNCCDSDIIWSGRCINCPNIEQCSENKKEEIIEVLNTETEKKSQRGDNRDDL